MKTVVTLITLLLSNHAVYAAKLADPLKPSSAMDYSPVTNEESITGTDLDELVLNSIIYSDKRKIAVINEAAYSEGQKVSGMKIIKIHPASVSLLISGKQKELSFPSAAVNKMLKRVW